MENNKQDDGPPGPLTPEETEDWLCDLDENVALAHDIGKATRYILDGLVGHLHRKGLIESHQLLYELRQGLSRIESPTERRTMLLLIDDLRLTWPSGSAGDEGGGDLPS